jgi:hypothetical protein
MAIYVTLQFLIQEIVPEDKDTYHVISKGYLLLENSLNLAMKLHYIQVDPPSPNRLDFIMNHGILVRKKEKALANLHLMKIHFLIIKQLIAKEISFCLMRLIH